MEFYLKEAFQSLKLLEDDFNLTADQGVIDELQSFVADDIEAPTEEEIIDVEADEVEDLQDNYIGKVILECDSCHTRIYKDIADVIIDEDSGLANIDEECPVCSNAFGWNVIGKIEKFDADAFEEEPKDEEEAEVEEEPEISDEEIGEALKEALNADEQRELNGIVYNHLADAAYEAEVNHGLDAYRSDMEKAQKAFNDDFYFGSVEEDVDVHVDQPEESDDVAINIDADDELHEEFENPEDVGVNPETASDDATILEEPMENPVTEIPDKLVVNESKLTEDINSVKELVYSYLYDKIADINDNLAYTLHDAIPEYDADWCIEDGLHDLVGKSEDAEDNYIQSLVDVLFANAPVEESLSEDIEDVQSEDAEKLIDPEEEPVKDLKEDLNEVEVHTDEQDIEVKTEDGKVVVEVGNPEEPEATAEDEMIAPLNAEEITDIENNEEQSAQEVAMEDELPAEEEPAEDELDIDEFDEESFDEIGESYLHRVYENVNSFKTTNVNYGKGKLVVEGLIKFNSGKEKKTTFIFENLKTTKRGKIVSEGLNETFSKSSKAFMLKGSLVDKKFVSESLIYNYTAKTINESNESEVTRVYGRAVRK